MRLGSIVMHEAVATRSSQRAKRIAAHVLEADPADIEFADGASASPAPTTRIGLFEVAAAAFARNDLPDELRGPLGAISDETIPDASFPYGTHVCEVEVDPDTGVVR